MIKTILIQIEFQDNKNGVACGSVFIGLDLIGLDLIGLVLIVKHVTDYQVFPVARCYPAIRPLPQELRWCQ